LSSRNLAGRLPNNFLFGVATASYQIEGAADEDGRGPSIWDAFSHMPGRVFEGHTGDVACDHYHRWEDDLDLIKSLNMEAYRFSIAWPRILPNGRGAVNEAGLDFYDRLLDGLKARGLKAFPTLYHWDLPLALMANGGWTDRNTADAFAEYTGHVMRRLGDRIDALATFNEPWCTSYLGHFTGKHAPGEKSLDAAMAATHVINLAHGKACLAARAERSDIKMGVVLNTQSTYAASDSEEDQAAAERYFQFHNEIYMGPMFAGRYGDQFLEAYGEKLNVVSGDMEIIHQPLDWWGVNYYYPATEVKPEGLTHLLKTAYDRYENMPPCYITENGACYNMGPDGSGEIDDQARLDYLNTQVRTIKKSGHWYADLAAQHKGAD